MSFSPLQAFVFIFLLAVNGWSAVPPMAKDAQQKLTAEVRAIFEAKCVDCHGSDLARPKGKFGYVLDLKRVAENPDYIVPGDAEKSELYTLVFHDEMPGEESEIPGLTSEEKEKVRGWIEIGAPSELPQMVEKVSQPTAAVSAPHVVQPLWKRSVRWVGKLHPLSTHFPVALMMVAVLAEAVAWWTQRESWMQTVRFLVAMAALGGLAAAGLGWMNAYFSSYDKAPGALLWWHRWLGSATSIWALVCASLACLGPCTEGTAERQRFRGALMLGAALVGVTGFLGSALVYGLDHYAWI